MLTVGTVLVLSVVALSAVEPGRALVWSDEFDVPGAPDPAIWGYEEGLVRNHEAQFYTRDRRENARVEDGCLVIEARKEAWEKDARFTSASLTTEGRRAIRFGRVEIRARIPAGRGLWPALWTLGTNRKAVGWPMCGEIDILENVGFDPDGIHFNLHTGDFNHVKKTGRGKRIAIANPSADFHVYAIEWTPAAITWSVDGVDALSLADDGGGLGHWPFIADQYLILNVAVGGGWGGQQGIDESVFPQRMLVDWVRVYEPLAADLQVPPRP